MEKTYFEALTKEKREILFRGKVKARDEWVEGYYYEGNRGWCYILTPKLKVPKNDGIVIGDSFEVYEVIPESIGQYSGFDDVFGVKIFEGDILYDGYDLMWVIKYENGAFVAQDLQGKTWFSLYEHKGYDEENKKECFYITEYRKMGNIYDNPELLMRESNVF